MTRRFRLKLFSLIHHIFVRSLPMTFWFWSTKFVFQSSINSVIISMWIGLNSLKETRKVQATILAMRLEWSKGIEFIVSSFELRSKFTLTRKQKNVHKKWDKLYWYSGRILEYISSNFVANFIGKWLLICLLIYYLFECRRINFLIYIYIWWTNESFFQNAKWESHICKM